MMWDQGMSWHTLVWIGMALFWALVIVLALTPTKYLLEQIDLLDDGDDALAAAPADAKDRFAGPGKALT